MNTPILLAVLLAISAIGFHVGRRRALVTVSGDARNLHSLPHYYGFYVALWCGLPALLIVGAWLLIEPKIIEAMVVTALGDQVRDLSEGQLQLMLNEIRNTVSGEFSSANIDPAHQRIATQYANFQNTGLMARTVAVIALGVAGLTMARRFVAPSFRARNKVEAILTALLVLSSMIAIVTTIGIVLSLLFEATRFFQMIPATDFLFGLKWSPQVAIRADQVGASGAFGVLPLLVGTLLISFIAMAAAAPIGLLSAIYMAEYAAPGFRAIAKPLLEILAGVPTVVYGFFAALTIAPLIRDNGAALGLEVSSESALAAGLVMGVMIIPFVSSLSDDVITAVPQSLREGAYGLGSTKSEMIKRVILPAALPGIAGSLLLAASRAIGETMIVVMAAGLAANLTANPFQAVTTVTVQIVTLLVGDQEFDSPKTLAAFALGLLLFLITLILNVLAFHIVRKYREQYD